MRATQKYFELRIRGVPRPKCGCHGSIMVWSKDDERVAGGWWRCKIKAREASRRYRERQRSKAAPVDDGEPRELIHVDLPGHGVVDIETSPDGLALVLANITRSIPA